ncbi:dTDP-4-dehydrorhamnose 3,5-epimerase [Flavobacteriaceae bacterium]|nr:dTDP-4-dehydrorhamnose 3,5-epimerase [Flavobacteriaceae bacterium]
MIVKTTPFKEVFILKPKVHDDERGFFMESYNEKEIEKALGRKTDFRQDNQTFSTKGVLRGLHYQLPPFSQTKLVSVIQGSVLDVVVDIRKGSPTFGQHFSFELSAENQIQLFIPRGFAHGFITLSETSIFIYKVDQYYNFASEGSIVPDDPALGIDWQLPQSEWIQSKKDKKHHTLAEAALFDYNTDLYV